MKPLAAKFLAALIVAILICCFGAAHAADQASSRQVLEIPPSYQADSNTQTDSDSQAGGAQTPAESAPRAAAPVKRCRPAGSAQDGSGSSSPSSAVADCTTDSAETANQPVSQPSPPSDVTAYQSQDQSAQNQNPQFAGIDDYMNQESPYSLSGYGGYPGYGGFSSSAIIIFPISGAYVYRRNYTYSYGASAPSGAIVGPILLPPGPSIAPFAPHPSAPAAFAASPFSHPAVAPPMFFGGRGLGGGFRGGFGGGFGHH